MNLQSDAVSREDLLSYVAAVEQNTTHPLAKAVVAHAKQEGSKLPQVESGTFQQVRMTFQQCNAKQPHPGPTIPQGTGLEKSTSLTVLASCFGDFRLQEPGSGAVGGVGGTQVVVGNRVWLQSHGILVPDTAVPEAVPGAGTCIFAGIGGEYAGMLRLQDEIREGAAHVVETLKGMGVQPVMLSGEHPALSHPITSLPLRSLSIRELSSLPLPPSPVGCMACMCSCASPSSPVPQ